MAWGARSGVDDLLTRLQQPATARSLCVLSFRKLSPVDHEKLARAIAASAQLEELFLSGHALGAAPLAAYADALATNTALQHLSIGDDVLGDGGVGALCAGLKRNAHSAVRTWDLEHKSLGVEGARALGALLASGGASALRELNLARNALGDDGIHALVAAEDGANAAPLRLETLTLSETGVSARALDHLALLLAQPQCALQTLQLSFNDLSHGAHSDAFFAALAHNTSLQKLYLKETKLSDAQAAALARALETNATLRELDVSDNALSPAASQALADALRKNRALEKLLLGGNQCGDTGARALADALRESDNATLAFLDLADNALTHEGVGALLGGAARLRSLRVFNNKLGDGLPQVLPLLAAHGALEALDLGANALHGALSVLLFDALHAHATLRTLEMGGNALGGQGHAALERLRAANPALDVAVDKNAQDEDGGVGGGDDA